MRAAEMKRRVGDIDAQIRVLNTERDALLTRIRAVCSHPPEWVLSAPDRKDPDEPLAAPSGGYTICTLCGKDLLS